MTINNARFAVAVALVALAAGLLTSGGASTLTLALVLVPLALAAVGIFGFLLVKRIRTEGVTVGSKTYFTSVEAGI